MILLEIDGTNNLSSEFLSPLKELKLMVLIHINMHIVNCVLYSVLSKSIK